MLGEFALALGECRPGSGDRPVFSVTQRVGVDNQGCGFLDSVRCEQIAQPRVDVGEKPVLADSETPRMVIRPQGSRR